MSRHGLIFFLSPPLTERKVPPNFTKKPSESMMDSAGKTVKMESRVSGSQPLTVTWYKNDNEIYGSDKHDVSFKNNVAVLCVREATGSDGGVYTCAASNEAGKASCRVSLTITGRSVSVYLHPHDIIGWALCYVFL